MYIDISNKPLKLVGALIFVTQDEEGSMKENITYLVLKTNTSDKERIKEEIQLELMRSYSKNTKLKGDIKFYCDYSLACVDHEVYSDSFEFTYKRAK